jgi:glycosyltransferase involved in cell wall biosynthesis
MTRHLVILTNIPTPYRVHFNNSLAAALCTREVSMEVVFMAHTEPGHHWRFDQRTWRFDYTFLPGWHPLVGGRIFHFNPSYVLDLITHPPDWMLAAGSWFLPTVLAANAIARLTKTSTFFWSESNLLYVEHTSELANRMRGWAMDSFDGYAIPGYLAREYVLHFSPSAAQKPLLELSNVVDEGRFRDSVTERRKRRQELLVKWRLEESNRPILFTAARLEPIKGIRELLRALVEVPTTPVTLLVAGDGSLRLELQAVVRQAGLEDRIRLLGYLDESEILDLLALADAFVLPSLGDPYPLAVVEAAFAGLPLLLSDRVGCHPEALVPGENGLLFDPYDQASIQARVEHFVVQGPEGWSGMGARSLEIAEDRFSTERVVTRFVNGLLRL